MIGYNDMSSEREVNNYLLKKYEYSLIQFKNSLHGIHTYYGLIKRKKSISEIEGDIEYLELSKEALVNKIKDFLTKSKSWSWIKNSYPNIDELTDEQKAGFITTKFQLHHYFNFIDLRKKRLNRIISTLESLHFHTENKRKGIQIETAAALVWILAFRKTGLTIKRSLAETRALLMWFIKNKRELLQKLSDLQLYKSKDALKRDNERYLQTPSDARREYKEIVESLYFHTFLNPDFS